MEGIDGISIFMNYEAKEGTVLSIESHKQLSSLFLKRASEIEDIIRPHFEFAYISADNPYHPRVSGRTGDTLDGELLFVEPTGIAYHNNVSGLSNGLLSEILGSCRKVEGILRDNDFLEPEQKRVGLHLAKPEEVEYSKAKFDLIAGALAENGYGICGASVSSPGRKGAHLEFKRLYNPKVYDFLFGVSPIVNAHSGMDIYFE